MKKFKKNWIKMNNDQVETNEEVTEETKEENDMNFFQRHKKGLIFGGLGALAATAAGFFFLLKNGSDDDYEDGDCEDLDDDSEASSSEE